MNAPDRKLPSGTGTSDIRSLGTEGAAYGPGVFIDEKLELQALRGRGGMGEVWIARHHLLDIGVAVKLIRSDRLSNNAAARLLREARAAARISHPAIARVLDFGRTSHFEPYIVMELLEGQSLAELLERETSLEPLRAVRLLLPIVHALTMAHRKSVIHRDLKPENIFIAITEDGREQPKLLDFGVSMSVGSERLTGKRRIVATPEYAAPEQAQGTSDIDERTDIWALCLVLYECVTGLRPFHRDSPTETLRATNTLAAFHASAVADSMLSAIIERGIKRDPVERWASMHDLGSALAAWLVHHGVYEDATGTTLKACWPNVTQRTTPFSRTLVTVLPTSGTMAKPGAAESAPHAPTTLDSLVPRVQPSTEPTLIAPCHSEDPPPSRPLLPSLPSAKPSSLRAWGLSPKRSG